MQEQKKNLNLKSILRFRNLFKNNKTSINPLLYLINNNFEYSITIKVKRNNVFCALTNIKKKKTVVLITSGKLKLKKSKKTLTF